MTIVRVRATRRRHQYATISNLAGLEIKANGRYRPAAEVIDR